MDAPIRFGIIACSNVARRRFLPALRASSSARLEHIGSRDPEKGKQYAREFSCEKFGSYEAVLSDPDVDAVYISTPPSLHEAWVNKAIAAGKHVLCEKPAFGDFDAAVSSVERCRNTGVRLMEGYSFKFHPQHKAVRSLIELGRIGQQRFFCAEFTYPRPPGSDIRLDPSLDGGVFCDSAGYPIAAALLQVSAHPATVFCQMSRDRAAGVDNSFCLWIRFAGGEMAQALVAFDMHYRSRYAVSGTRGRVEVARAFAVTSQMKTTITLETDDREENIVLEPADQFCLMVDEFCAQIRGASPWKDFEGELLLQHAVMDASARSNRERRAIDLSEYAI